MHFIPCYEIIRITRVNVVVYREHLLFLFCSCVLCIFWLHRNTGSAKTHTLWHKHRTNLLLLYVTSLQKCGWNKATNYSHWWRKLKKFEGDGEENLGWRWVIPSKTHQFWPICLLPMDNFAIFLHFSFLFIFLLFFILLRILGGMAPLLKISCPPHPPSFRHLWL